jgi:hypothetical protein
VSYLQGTSEGMQDTTGPRDPVGFQQFLDLTVGIPNVKDNGEASLFGQPQLQDQGRPLGWPRRKIAEEIQADLSDSHHPRVGCKSLEFCQKVSSSGGQSPLWVSNLRGVMGMDTHSGQDAGIGLSQGHRLLATGKIVANVQKTSDLGFGGPCQYGRPIWVELVSVEVDVTIGQQGTP